MSDIEPTDPQGRPWPEPLMTNEELLAKIERNMANTDAMARQMGCPPPTFIMDLETARRLVNMAKRSMPVPKDEIEDAEVAVDDGATTGLFSQRLDKFLTSHGIVAAKLGPAHAYFNINISRVLPPDASVVRYAYQVITGIDFTLKGAEDDFFKNLAEIIPDGARAIVWRVPPEYMVEKEYLRRVQHHKIYARAAFLSDPEQLEHIMAPE